MSENKALMHKLDIQSYQNSTILVQYSGNDQFKLTSYDLTLLSGIQIVTVVCD